MKDKLVSDMILNISDEYLDEALESQMSENSNMKTTSIKKILITGIAASLAVAFGVTAFATEFFGVMSRDGEPGETAEVVSSMKDDFGGTVSVEAEYENISKVFSFTGSESCKAIEFKADYLPEGYSIRRNGNDWCTRLLGDTAGKDSELNFFGIEVFYIPQFSTDGNLYLQDTIVSEDCSMDGNREIYKITTNRESDSCTFYYYIIIDKESGYIISVCATESMNVAEQVATHLDIRQTDKTITAGDTHDFHITSAMG